jgi:hypothetical protein
MSVAVKLSTPVPPVRIVAQVEVPGQAIVAAMSRIVEYWDGNGPLETEEAVKSYVTTYIVHSIAARLPRLVQDMDWLFSDEKWALKLGRGIDHAAATLEPATQAEYAAWEAELEALFAE